VKGEALARADRAWLAKLVTRCEQPAKFMNALHRQPDDIKVIQFAEA
jgi:glucose 1-dehydrogenase